MLPVLLDTNCGCKMPEHKAAGWKTPIWDVYRQIITEGNGGVAVEFEEVERSVRALQCCHNSCEEQGVLKDLAVTWEKLSQVVAWCVRCGNHRFAFYERARKAYAVVATGETALYGNLILKKGVIGTKD